VIYKFDDRYIYIFAIGGHYDQVLDKKLTNGQSRRLPFRKA